MGGEQVAADSGQPQEQRERQEDDAANHREIGGDGVQRRDREDQEIPSQSFQAVRGGPRAILPQLRESQHQIGRGAAGCLRHHRIRFLLRDRGARREQPGS